jgi:hypothetical protein
MKSALKSLTVSLGVLSCCAGLTPALSQTNPVTPLVDLPIKLRQGDVMAEVRVNGSEPLSFKIDTGFGVTTIHPDLAERLKLSRNGHLTIEGIAGDEEAPTYGGATFDFGGVTYEPRRVAALPSEARRRGRHRDGILGAGFFRRFVVELDTAKRRMRLYDPQKFSYTGKGQVLPIEFKRDTPIIQASITPLEGPSIADRFEIDTGCDDCVCLGHEFVSAHHLLESTNSSPSGIKRGIGGSAEVQHGKLAELRLGELVIKDPSANFFREGSPAGQGQAGHIGLGALERFKMTFDYSRRQLILEP